MKTRSGLIAALDVGTTKVCCFIARPDADGEPRVIGIGHQVSQGLRCGNIVDMEAAETSIRAAVHAAEQMAGTTIRDVFVNLSGGHPASHSYSVEMSIAGHEVGESDLRRILDQRRLYENGSEREFIHFIPVGYSIDGNRGIRDPRGMYGERLGVNMHVITSSASAVRNLANCVARCHLDVGAFVVSAYASGLACLSEDETKLGVTLVDMGGGTTTFAVFVDGVIVYTGCVPLGGAHVTSDIARGLSTPLAHAERMKTLYGNAIPSPLDEREIIDVPQVGEESPTQANHVPKSILTGIIQPRLEETFELVRGRLEAGGFDKSAGRRVVLTGGASQLQGVRELATLVLDKQVRMARPVRLGGLAEATCGPAFSTCAGLLTYAVHKHAEPPGWTAGAAEGPGGLIGRLGHWIREYL